ncbi:MAG: M48 family metalloprotease [Syntrophobacteraceae bacterium]
MNYRSFFGIRRLSQLLSVVLLSLIVSSCVVAPIVGLSGGAASGIYAIRHPESITRTAGAIGKSFKDITPEQEYYIGRAVAAIVLKHYPPYADATANRYLNLVGQALAEASDRPETFGGYHFLIVDSDEINAFAAPGGLILVTRGMLRQCKSEDELAAVLAHEIGHVVNQSGLKAIQQSRVISALGILASEGTKVLSGGTLAPLVEAFEGSVGDVASTIMNNGYSRDQERQADESAVLLLRRVGYDPGALVSVLQGMPEATGTDRPRFARSHPKLVERVRYLGSDAGISPRDPGHRERDKRFKRFVARV